LKGFLPLFDDGSTANFNDFDQKTQFALRYLGIVVLHEAFTGPGDPNFCGIGHRTDLSDVYMNRLQGIALIDQK